jgi:hypothetical protein
MDAMRFLFDDGKGGFNAAMADDAAIVFRESSPSEVAKWLLEILEAAMKLPDKEPDRLPENDFAVNEAIRLIFQQGREPLRGVLLYIIEAMGWGLENGAAGWADQVLEGRLWDQVEDMQTWEPMDVMQYMYNDGYENFDEDAMQEEAHSLDGMTPAQAASFLLDTLKCQMD